jgi:transcriptional regulator with XRE-family HTH domain
MIGFNGKELGRRVRRARLARALTLKQIEAAVGVSATHVSEIERGKTSPTIGALHKIADALSVDVACLIQPDSHPSLHVQRKADGSTLVIADGALILRPLSSGLSGSEMSLFVAELEPARSADPRPRPGWGEQMVVGLAGGFVLLADGDTYHVREGDSLHVKVNRDFRVRNDERERAQFLWGTYPKYVL